MRGPCQRLCSPRTAQPEGALPRAAARGLRTERQGQHDGQNAYLFYISADGSWRFQKISPTDLFPESPKHEIFVYPKRDRFVHAGGTTNTLLVRAVGHHFTFFANNLKLGEADDTDSETYS